MTMPEPAPFAEAAIDPPNDRKALEWIVALAAAGLPYRLVESGGAWRLLVPAELGPACREAIRGYEEANIGWPPTRPARPDVASGVHPLTAGLLGSGFLAMVYACFGPYAETHPWLRAAAADAAAIRAGQWWRPITALTLHADLQHLAANLVFLGLLGALICLRMGIGLGWALVLAAGASGNLLTALVYRTPHQSVGASTAVFGALGILAMGRAVEVLRRTGYWRSIWSRVWLPLCAGLALLGLYGTSPHTDIVAHAAGFLCGMALAAPIAAARPAPPSEWVDALLRVAGILAILLAWRAAIRFA